MKRNNNRLSALLTGAVCLLLVVCLGYLLGLLVRNVGVPGRSVRRSAMELAAVDRFDMQLSNMLADVYVSGQTVQAKKVYWLNDSDPVAPEPNPAGYGQSDDPAALQEVLDRAWEMLDIQDPIFTAETPIMPGSAVYYYLDETIFAVTWKQVMDNCVYTFSEVKVAHPSQFRRFLAGDKFGNDQQLLTSEMASTVNAVVASSGDFYGFRFFGVVVYNGVVERSIDRFAQTCYVDEKGDLIFMDESQFDGQPEKAQAFVDEHQIRFSLAFGPVLIDEGQLKTVNHYDLGQIHGRYSRAALCQRGERHYVLTAANYEGDYRSVPTLREFSQRLHEIGFEKAYALDGGQTAAIVMNDTLINKVSYGAERKISDIIYFATAIPKGGQSNG